MLDCELKKNRPVWIVVFLDDHCLRAGPGHLREGALEFLRPADQDWLNSQAAARARHSQIVHGFVVAVVPRTATQVRFGMFSRRSCKRLPASSASIPDRPVAFPLGRAKLSTKPLCKGAPTTMTM